MSVPRSTSTFPVARSQAIAIIDVLETTPVAVRTKLKKIYTVAHRSFRVEGHRQRAAGLERGEKFEGRA